MDGLECNQSRFVLVALVPRGGMRARVDASRERPELNKLADSLCRHGVNNL